MKLDKILLQQIDEIGDQHLSNTKDTPLRPDAFEMSNTEKMMLIEEKIREVLHILGMDLTDDSLCGTPKRVAKMYVNEIFSRYPDNKPKNFAFENKYQRRDVGRKKRYPTPTCEHHHFPSSVSSRCLSQIELCGLSKMNRIVDYFAKRPQDAPDFSNRSKNFR